ncbi:MAG: response regulator [Candidatus Polarisedimenticolia bacterium]
MLVVDDEPAVAALLREGLSDHGYAVTAAGGAEEALAKVRAGRFDAALCDLSLQDAPGLVLIDRLHELQPDLPVIVITGHGTLENAVESLRRGVADFLQKPLVFKEVLFSVGRALEHGELLQRVGLYELSRSLFATLDPEELYGRVAQAALRVLRADDASLMLLDGNRALTIALSTSLDAGIRAATRLPIGERIAGRVALQPEPMLILDDASRDHRFAGLVAHRRIHAAIVCPLTMHGEPLGVLNVSRVRIAEPFNERDRRIAAILSSLVALALGNARLHEELQARVEALRDTQEEVIQSEKMTALGSLLSGVAHELNNPLCGVLGYAQLLRQAPVDDRTRRGLEVILRETDRAARIVGNLLRFARRERPEKRPLGLNGLMLKAIERRAADLKMSRILVGTDLGPDVPDVLGDRQQLLTAFGNLITNAQQAMFEHRGSGTLSIRSERRGGMVAVSIADDGPGIAAEHVRRVFDPFFTTKSVGKGTGLGLSVAFAIVRDHGGTIRVVPGAGGATFVVELPMASAEALEEAGRAAPHPVSPAAAVVAADPRGASDDDWTESGPRILVAEEDERIRDLLLMAVTGMGYRAEGVATGEALLDRVRDGQYIALIADYALPRLDGHGLLAALRNGRPDLLKKVIFIAADAADPRLMAFASDSGTPVVRRPPDPSTLRAALHRLLAASLIEEAPVH